MKTLDDELLSVIRLMKKQTYSQKLRVLNSLSEQQNYIVADNRILFLTKTSGSEEVTCQYTLEIDHIFSVLYTGSFLFILFDNYILNVLDLNSHTLYFWHPTTDNAFERLLVWECRTKAGMIWPKLLNRIKHFFASILRIRMPEVSDMAH